jgi:hypothetical protein
VGHAPAGTLPAGANSRLFVQHLAELATADASVCHAKSQRITGRFRKLLANRQVIAELFPPVCRVVSVASDRQSIVELGGGRDRS